MIAILKHELQFANYYYNVYLNWISDAHKGLLGGIPLMLKFGTHPTSKKFDLIHVKIVTKIL